MLLEAGGKICRVNQAARRLFGLTENLSAIWDDENKTSAVNFLQEQGGCETSQLKLRLHDGQKVQFIAHVATLVRDGQDYFVLQLFKDSGSAFPELAYVPAPMVMHAQIQNDPPALAPPESDDDFLLQNADWPVLLVHKNGKVLRANRAGVRAFGASIEREEAQLEAIWSPHNGDSCAQFLNLPPSSEPVALQFHLKSGLPGDYWGQLCTTGKEDILLLQLLKGPPPKSETAGGPKPMPVKAAPVGEGVEASLAHKQKLDCALQLARSVALDFNNALTSILGHTSLLLSKSEINHPWRSSLGEIEKSAAKAAEIANDLAAFSRQEKDTRVHVAGNLNMLLERTVEMFQGMTQPSVVISRHLERKLFTANFDEAKMQQALVKIFENAFESIKGQGKITVQTRNLELTEATQDRTARLNPGNYVCVEISDTGSGIADDVMPRIFEPFFSTKGTRHRGLGLAWVYGIVTNHGGGVAVSSQPNIGTAVRLYLPANRKIVRDAPLADSDLTGMETILLVDDEDLLLTMGRMVLASYGYTVLAANSGQKAIELFTRAKKKIDLVITDLVMPNMSGRELSEHILRVSPETRIIWSSGYVRSANAQEQERYLQKPFSAQDLLRKVKQVLMQ
jgi:nitrogen-specific signal transduction histidine kinase/CheY-like chemotaxis protein/PAS domain-containing protein